jgi:DNA (cytosine-5)-methyltransferase 1
MKIGSLCSGYGGLDMAVEAFYDANTAWMCDIDKYASIVIKERWGLPNLGDMKEVEWSNVEPVDILTAGYPCQPFSTAGQRKGSEDERHLWPYIKEIISQLQPKRVILENVRGHLTLGFKEVLADLAEIGYDAKWAIIRASDVGAPHQRARLFVTAYPNSQTHNESRRANRPIPQSSSEVINWPDRNEYRSSVEDLQRPNTNSERRDLGTQGTQRHQGQSQSQFAELGKTATYTSSEGFQGSINKRDIYAECSDIWNRQIPNPLAEDKLNPKFVEYMMGLPEGWVTDLDISRSQQLKLLGNGVVPQQAYYAISQLERF